MLKRSNPLPVIALLLLPLSAFAQDPSVEDTAEGVRACHENLIKRLRQEHGEDIAVMFFGTRVVNSDAGTQTVAGGMSAELDDDSATLRYECELNVRAGELASIDYKVIDGSLSEPEPVPDVAQVCQGEIHRRVVERYGAGTVQFYSLSVSDMAWKRRKISGIVAINVGNARRETPYECVVNSKNLKLEQAQY